MIYRDSYSVTVKYVLKADRRRGSGPGHGADTSGEWIAWWPMPKRDGGTR